jgi:hypothetical protein
MLEHESDVLIRFPNRRISLHDVDESDTFIHHTDHTLVLAACIERQSSLTLKGVRKLREAVIHPTPNFKLMNSESDFPAKNSIHD